MVDTSDRYDLGTLFERTKRFCLVNIRWITRAVMVLLVTLLLLHAFYAPSVDWVGEALHLCPHGIVFMIQRPNRAVENDAPRASLARAFHRGR